MELPVPAHGDSAEEPARSRTGEPARDVTRDVCNAREALVSFQDAQEISAREVRTSRVRQCICFWQWLYPLILVRMIVRHRLTVLKLNELMISAAPIMALPILD